jgi:hypothetical protein
VAASSFRRWAFLLLLTACTSTDPVDAPDPHPESDGSGRDAPDGASASSREAGGRQWYPSQIPEGYVCEPTLDSLGPGLFESSCIFDTCHGNNDAAWGLRFTGGPDGIASAVLDEEAATCKGWMLIVPGEPEQSFLWHKVVEAEPECGDRMPRGIEPLPQSVIDCLTDWIKAL